MSAYTARTRCQSCRRRVKAKNLAKPCPYCGSEVNAYAMQKHFAQRQSALKVSDDVKLIAILAVGFMCLLITGRVISFSERIIEQVKHPKVAERIAKASLVNLAR